MPLVAEQVAETPPTHVLLEPGQEVLVMHPRHCPALQVVPALAHCVSVVHACEQVPGTPPTQVRDPPHSD